MADTKSTAVKGGLNVARRLFMTDAEKAARRAELMSHSGDKTLPLVLPRARLSPEFIDQQADRVARQMLGEHVTSGKPKDTVNLAGRSMKESQRVKGLNYKLSPTGTVAQEGVYVPRKGDVKVAFPGDQTVSNKILEEVEGFPIDSVQEGGAYYGLGQKHLPEPEFWKSTETPAKGVQGKIDRVAELYEPERVIGSHLAMGPMSNNFAMHFADANLRAIDWSKANPKKINIFDNIIASGYKDPKTGEIVRFPNWPGLADRDAALAAMKEDSNLRKWFNNRMKVPKITEPLGLPNGLDIQYAITEPRIRDMEINMTGLMTGQLKPGALVEAAGNPHNTYSHRILGEAEGPQEVLTPFVIGFPDAAQHIATTKRPSDFTGTIQKVFPHQIVDDQYLDEYNRYRERIKKLTGQKKGGEVDIDAADARLTKAIEARMSGDGMAKGGEVDISAADARLEQAVAQRMAGGGKAEAVKGVAKGFKRLFADRDVLPLAEREANKAKFLDESKIKERVYHGTGADISEFKPSVVGAMGPGTYVTTKPKTASEYSNVVSHRRDKNDPNVLPLNVQVKNPFPITNVGRSGSEFFLHFDPTGKLSDAEVIELAKKAGYDAVHALQEGEINVFDPRRIKSDIGNRGTYDVNDPDITKAHGGLAMAGGGKATALKGALNIGKRLLAEPAAESKIIQAPSVVIPSKLSNVKEAVRQSKGDFGARRVERAADEIPNLERMYKEEGLRSAFTGDNAQAVMTMKPGDFEKFAKRLEGRTSADIGPKMAELAKKGEIDKYTLPTDEYVQYLKRLREGFDDVPFLGIDKEEFGLPLKPFISGHEGRHRSRALAESGQPTSLVRLIPRAELREPFPRRSQEEYLDALRQELDLTGNLVLPEGGGSPLILPDIYAEGGDVHMADGGKAGAVKGALNLGRRLLAERPALPAAEREANLAKFLEPSKTPMRLYHGTTATEGGKGTEAIRRIKPSKEGSLGSGVYLTPSPAHASGYSGVPNDEALELMLASPYQQDTALGLLNKRNAGEMLPGQEGGNMLPVYAQVKNPLVIEGTHADPMIEALVKLGVDEDKAVRMVERAYENKGYIGKEVETRARAAGYDGLMQYRNGDLSEVVSYNPNAVKSAIGNEGTYDTSVPDLSKAEGGSVFKKIQFMDRGGITTSGGTFTPEDLGVTSAELNAPIVSKDRMRQIRANAAELWDEGKGQLEKEYRQLSRPGGKKDFAIRVGSQILGGVPDLINLGLEGVDLVQSAIPGLGKPASVLDTAGTGDRIPKFRLASDEPWLGSQLFMRKFKEAELLGKNEFPLTELAAGFASPAIAAGAIKGGKKAVKAIADAPKKRRGGLTAMTR